MFYPSCSAIIAEKLKTLTDVPEMLLLSCVSGKNLGTLLLRDCGSSTLSPGEPVKARCTDRREAPKPFRGYPSNVPLLQQQIK